MDILLYAALAAFVILLTVVLVRALLFNPKPQKQIEAEKIELDEEKIVSDMAEMIRCKTVSYKDFSLEDEQEFEKFRNLLKEKFPLVHSACVLEHIGRNGLLYKLSGESSQRPSVCMAHYDVVPVNEQLWSNPAFEGIVENGVMWGRGTLDTKGTLCGIFEALEQLLKDGFKPKNDLYLSFSGEEEIYGETCSDIVSYFENNAIKPALVLDEGGAVVENVFPGVSKPSAMVGIAEKGGVNLDFSLNSNGGHSSTPPTHTIVGELSRAVTKIENKPFKFRLTKPAREMFDTIARYSIFPLKIIFANLWLFSPVLNLICKMSGGELNALVRTTTAVTCMQGSDAYNVIPPKASFGVNMRLIDGDTVDSAVKYLKKIIKNDSIEIRVVDGNNPSICSQTSCDEWDIVAEAINKTWPEAIVSPYLMMACSDSRHYCRITDRVYRFCPMFLSKEERGMIHGNDERVPIKTLVKTVEFYVNFIKSL